MGREQTGAGAGLRGVERLAILTLTLAFVFAFSAAASADQTLATCAPPSDVSGCQMQALTVPENPGNPSEPHPTVSGALITLGGIARYGGDQYMWDFGDGTTPSAWESITNPYDLGIKHVYVGAIDSLYSATLSVRDSANPSVVTTAAYPVEIESSGTSLSDPAQLAVSARMAVDESLWYLHVQETRSQFGGGSPGYGQPYGYWDGGDLGSTCLAVDTLEGHGSRPNGSDNDPYVEDVQRALASIATQWDAMPISQTFGGDPDSNGNGIGLAIDARTPAETYTSAVCAMALADSGVPNLIATTGGPWVFGRPYSAIAQDAVDWFAYSQNQLNSGPAAGSWGYEANTAAGTNEVTRWVILALEAAQNQMDATVPPFVPAGIPDFLNYTTDENPSSNNYGGLGDFNAGDSLTGIGFTAGGIITDEFLGAPSTSPSIEASLGYIYRHWNDNNGSSDTNLGDSDAMYSVMRALTGMSPAAAEVANYDPFTGLPTGGSFDWYATPVGQAEEGYATNLIPRQQADGSWVDSTGAFGFHYGTVVAETALDTSILASSIPAAPTEQPTSTQLASTANPSAFSAPVTYTATVSVFAPGVGTPTGTVAFTDGGQPIAGCSAVTLSGTASLTASCTTTPSSPGSHPVVATYSGDSNYESSTGSLSQAVADAIPTLSTQASGGVMVTGSVSDTVTVSAGSDPTGTLTFKLFGPNDPTCSNPAAPTATATVNGNGVNSSGPLTPTMAGTYEWVVSYSGDANNTTASGSCGDAHESVVVSPPPPPVVTVPSSLAVEATGPGGAAVTFSASAGDVIDGPIVATCAPVSGSTFPLGTTTVECSATDSQSVTGSASFTVTVQDTTPPALSLPADISVVATRASGAAVTFAATATDLVDGTDPVPCLPASGSTFPIGVTSVACSSTDAHGNKATGSFTVTVADAPTLHLPGDLVVEATRPSGASVKFTATATDPVDGSDRVSCSPRSGSAFPLGVTTVNCSATDAHGSTVVGSFTVTVQDTTPPRLHLPHDRVVEALGPFGRVVRFHASAFDLVDGPVAVSCSPASGSTFHLGTTTVHCSATDADGNRATGTFTVTVVERRSRP